MGEEKAVGEKTGAAQNETDMFGNKSEQKSSKKKPNTINGYRTDEVKSALQKSIRRGDDVKAMFWARELAESGLGYTLWSRLKAIAIEDCAGMLPMVFVAECAQAAAKSWEKSMYAAKAARELALWPKDRTADDANCWFADGLNNGEVSLPVIPEYAFDGHTQRGRSMGRMEEFFWNETSKLENESPAYNKQFLKDLKKWHPMKEGE